MKQSVTTTRRYSTELVICYKFKIFFKALDEKSQHFSHQFSKATVWTTIHSIRIKLHIAAKSDGAQTGLIPRIQTTVYFTIASQVYNLKLFRPKYASGINYWKIWIVVYNTTKKQQCKENNMTQAINIKLFKATCVCILLHHQILESVCISSNSLFSLNMSPQCLFLLFTLLYIHMYKNLVSS